MVGIWDERNMSAPFHALMLHSDVVDVSFLLCARYCIYLGRRGREEGRRGEGGRGQGGGRGGRVMHMYLFTHATRACAPALSYHNNRLCRGPPIMRTCLHPVAAIARFSTLTIFFSRLPACFVARDNAPNPIPHFLARRPHFPFHSCFVILLL